MSKYLLIESRDPFASADTRFFYDLAATLAGEGHDVTLFLVENGVLAGRRGAADHPLEPLARKNVRILADELSLRERGIRDDERIAGAEATSIDTLVELLLDETVKAFWH